MIEEQFISLDTARMLKEVGFDVPCTSQYTENEFAWENLRKTDFNKSDYVFSRPTQALAAMWLREKFGIHIFTNYFFEDGTWFYVTVDLKESDEVRAIHPDIRSYPTCEEALEAGLQEAIKLIKK